MGSLICGIKTNNKAYACIVAGITEGLLIGVVARFDDLSSFWRFWAPKMPYWRFDDLCPYYDDFWKLKTFIIIFTSAQLFATTFDDFSVFYCFFILINPKCYNVCTKVVLHTNYPTKEQIILRNKFIYMAREKSVVILTVKRKVTCNFALCCTQSRSPHENFNPFSFGCNRC